MANDREILREIWVGKLPICFRLNPEEVYEMQQPDPFYLMVPRLSYFPLVVDKVICIWVIYKQSISLSINTRRHWIKLHNISTPICIVGQKTFHAIRGKWQAWSKYVARIWWPTFKMAFSNRSFIWHSYWCRCSVTMEHYSAFRQISVDASIQVSQQVSNICIDIKILMWQCIIYMLRFVYKFLFFNNAA